MIDEIVGRYRIVDKLGEGGMGVVWLGEHLTLGRKDAVKVLRQQYAADPNLAGRFRREARAANRLQHPNIVRVYDFGRLDDGRLYLAMELAAGESLAEIVSMDDRMPVGRVLHVLTQLADAVEHAHARNVLHRDLKPGNLVLVEQRGRRDVLKVLDFGIAKIVGDAESRQISMRGEVYGTAYYVSPEQIRGVGDDPRSDLYSIGCLAYELLTGDPPFRGQLLEVMRAHVMKTPEPIVRRRSEVPKELDEVILCLLEKDAGRRFQSAAALKRALEQVPGWDARPMRRWSWRNSQSSAHDFEADTDAEWRGPQGRRTEDVPTRGARCESLRSAADSLFDVGSGGAELVVKVAELNQLEDELTSFDAELAALDRRADELEQVAQERESALGFRLGDLHYEREQQAARGVPVDEIDRAIVEHEVRLSSVDAERVRALTEITDRSIALTAERVHVEEKLDKVCDALTVLLERLQG